MIRRPRESKILGLAAATVIFALASAPGGHPAATPGSPREGPRDAWSAPVPFFSESFDAVAAPLLPRGWETSSRRASGGDFISTTSGAASPPGCVLSANAAVEQTLTTSPIGAAEWRGMIVAWSERRSSSHDASITLGASIDGGATYETISVPPFPPPGGTSFVVREAALPGWAGGAPDLRLRWTVNGDGSGLTGTIRIDDVSVRGFPSRDLAVLIDSISPRRPSVGVPAVCAGRVVNNGAAEVEWASVRWAVDQDGDGVFADGEFGEPVGAGPIPPGEWATYAFTFVRRIPAGTSLAVFLDDADGLVGTNDTAAVRLPPSAAPGSVAITEIMYDPLSGLAEYIEVFNTSAETVDVASWRLVDSEEDSTGGILGGAGKGADANVSAASPVGGGIFLPPGGYLVASPDSGVRRCYPGIPAGSFVAEGVRGLSLNNAGDLLLLVDGWGDAVDRVFFRPEWHTPALDQTRGRSLERIDPTAPGNEGWNWGSSAGPGGGTPGAANSLASAGRGGPGEIECRPNPFSPDGDGHDDVVIIRFRPPGGAAIARARIFDIEGNLVRTLTGGAYLGPEGTFAWNGYDDRGIRASIGIYVVVVDALDGSGSGSTAVRTTVVLAGRL